MKKFQQTGLLYLIRKEVNYKRWRLEAGNASKLMGKCGSGGCLLANNRKIGLVIRSSCEIMRNKDKEHIKRGTKLVGLK